MFDTATLSQSRSTPSTSFVALLNDAVGDTTVAIPKPPTEPRFRIRTIKDHNYDGEGRLIFDVQWKLEGSHDTQELFSNLHHLDALSAYELSIRTPLGSGHAASRWNVYELQKGVELLELVSEDDTNSNVSETLDPASLDLDVGQYLLEMPLSPMLDMTLLPSMLNSPGSSADFWGSGDWNLDLGVDHNLGSTLT